MSSLKSLCTPRASTFDTARRDTALDLTDLLERRIPAAEFFKENYRTHGMTELFRNAFRRFGGRSAPPVIKLTQAMGGGKTHSLVALGLLARHPELRPSVLGDLNEAPGLGEIKVIGFTGRESDTPLGIWGALASQLGKRDQFRDYYTPLSAPGVTAWIELLKGSPLLVLLDELPPYFENARGKAIGNTDLSVITTTALSNLFVALTRPELSNVCVVITDLAATYGDGTAALGQALANLNNESNRVALPLQPVGLNTDELYQILRTRLFEKLPAANEIREVAQAYGKSVRDARQMDLTSVTPETLQQQIEASYPFHPSIRDLYARFKENPGFQQTRALIRLMRIVVSRLWEQGGADERQLIAPFDLDLNDRETLGELSQINPTLQTAVSHDIASNGGSQAEQIDAALQGHDGKETATLLLVASLANVPNAVLGLSMSDLVAYLAAPGRNLSRWKSEVLTALSTRCWYLHSTRDGKLFFKNTENLQAKLHTLAKGYLREQTLGELKKRLEAMFKPTTEVAYQKVLVLPPLDTIMLDVGKTTLVVSEPQPNTGLNPRLKEFFDTQEYKNRVLFLTGESASMEILLERAAEAKAIDFILDEMKRDGVPDNDPQRQLATETRDRLAANLFSATRESFQRLWYPSVDGSKNSALRAADFLMEFRDNKFDGEAQITRLLEEKSKLTTDVESDGFRLKCEQRLFTQQSMPWAEVKRRAASRTDWQLHPTGALDHLRRRMALQGQWRDEGDHVNKGPFPKPEAHVRWEELSRNHETGEVVLRLTAVHGDAIHYELGQDATTASAKVKDPRQFRTTDLSLSFLCVDSTGQHKSAAPVAWKNRITLRSKQYKGAQGKLVELAAAPPAPIRYTTDGSDPRKAGGLYSEPIVVPSGTVVVLAIAEKDGLQSDQLRVEIDWTQRPGFEIDKRRPLTWTRLLEHKTSKDSFDFLRVAKKHGGKLVGPGIRLAGSRWLELSAQAAVVIEPNDVEPLIEHLRKLLPTENVEVVLTVERVRFDSGQQFLDYIDETRIEFAEDEIDQRSVAVEGVAA